MARTIEEIQIEIIQAKENNPELDTLNSTSKVAIWRLWIYVVAFCIWTLEILFDTHKAEVSEMLSELKPHTARWYRNKSLSFQYGFSLIEDSDKYDNKNYTEEQIENSKIIKYSAVTEAKSRLIIKIAGETGDKLQPISEAERLSFKEYIEEIKDAGVKITVINYPPDILSLKIRIKYDPLVLMADGMHIINANYPVEDGLEKFMKSLPFNGELVIADLACYLNKLDGVIIASIDEASSKWVDDSGNYGNAEAIDISKIPESGYFEIENFDNIKYIV